MSYVYLGDRMTDPTLRGQRCDAVRRSDGKCITGRGAMLVAFADGEPRVIVRRMLRRITADNGHSRVLSDCGEPGR